MQELFIREPTTFSYSLYSNTRVKNLCWLFLQNYFEKREALFAKNSVLSRYSPLLDIY